MTIRLCGVLSKSGCFHKKKRPNVFRWTVHLLPKRVESGTKDRLRNTMDIQRSQVVFLAVGFAREIPVKIKSAPVNTGGTPRFASAENSELEMPSVLKTRNPGNGLVIDPAIGLRPVSMAPLSGQY